MTNITADSTTLMRQAPMTANTYLDAAIEGIDGRFGKGFAKAHPELVGAYLQTCALDFGAAVIARAIEDTCGVTADTISEGVGGITDQLDYIDKAVNKLVPRWE